MPLSIIIDAPIQEVFDVLDTPQLNDVWNPVTHKVIPSQADPSKCAVESFMGKFDTEKTTVGNTNVKIKIIGNPVLSELNYDLVKLSPNQTRVDGTIKLTSGAAHYTIMHKSVGIELLHNLKRYIEYIRGGGSDTNFKKVMKS